MKKMTEKRCLNCQDYRPDHKSMYGEPLPEGVYPYSGVCSKTNKRMADGWACGKWRPNEELK